MGQIEKPKLPELHDRMSFGGYTILWDERSGRFVVWGDNGRVTDGFATKEEAMAWAIDNPKTP
jgi:hypothetical protein